MEAAVMQTISRPVPVLALAVLFGNCATTESYPEDWSSPGAVEVGECADISGIFSNSCTPKDKYDNTCRESGGLAGRLFAQYAGSFHPKLGTADRVVVSQPTSKRLFVEAWNGEDLVREGEIDLALEDCTEDGVLIRTGLKGTQIEGGIGTGSSQALFSKTEDGDLIAQLKTKFTGVWFVVPVSGSSQVWLRFECLPEGEANQP